MEAEINIENSIIYNSGAIQYYSDENKFKVSSDIDLFMICGLNSHILIQTTSVKALNSSFISTINSEIEIYYCTYINIILNPFQIFIL